MRLSGPVRQRVSDCSITRWPVDRLGLTQPQDDLCAQIGVEVDSRVAAGASWRLRHGTDNAKAGGALVNAFASLARYTRESLSACQRDADIALVLDPDYLGAMAMAAITRTHRVLNGWAECPLQSNLKTACLN